MTGHYLGVCGAVRSGRASRIAPTVTAANATRRSAPRRARGNGLAQHDHTGGDRQRVREQCRQAGDGERAALLVAELQEGGAERVTDDHAEPEHDARAPFRRDLDRDVADGEEQPAGDAFGNCERAEGAPEQERDDRRCGRRGKPEHDRSARAAVPSSVPPASDTASGAARTSTRRRPRARVCPAATAEACRDEREDADPARGDALDECERSERERGDVEGEAGALEGKAEEPAAISQQRRRRVKRSPQRQRRQRGGGIVLAQVRDVDQCRRHERQQERKGSLAGHRRGRLLRAEPSSRRRIGS